ncbi:hypothetical protein [Streptomyces tendae]|uniref:hypothetical protein n=1 Tax=Streptomyces tendae TaxID=1932 RepID=UPI00369E23CA
MTTSTRSPPWSRNSRTSRGHVRSTRTGLCLDADRGKRYLGAPLEPGAELTQETCAGHKRTQRRQLTARRGALT